MIYKTISGYELIKEKVINIDFCIKKNRYILLKGYVVSPYKFPIKNAAVEITIIDKKNHISQEIQKYVTFTQDDGMYGISVPYEKWYSYILKAYST